MPNQTWYVPADGTSTVGYGNVDKDDNMSPCVRLFGEEGGLNVHRAGNNILLADGHVTPYRKIRAAGDHVSPDGAEGLG